MNTSILDHDGLVQIFNGLAGRTFIGAIDCGDGAIELVFASGGTGNLVTVFTNGPFMGSVAHGYVETPKSYYAGAHRHNLSKEQSPQ